MSAESSDEQDNNTGKTPVLPQRPPFEVLIWRALKLRCPKCGQGKLYQSMTAMSSRCSHCDLKIDRAEGYYLGATYVNYGLTAVSMTFLFFLFKFGLGFPTKTILWPLFGYCVIFPLLIFRHGRALWLAIDCQFDRSVLAGDE